MLSIPISDATHVLASGPSPRETFSVEEAAEEQGELRSYKSLGLYTACTPRGCGSGQGVGGENKVDDMRQTDRNGECGENFKENRQNDFK